MAEFKSNYIQPSFAAGELSPTLFGRVDLAKYKIGAARARNMIVEYRGGISNRPGTMAIGRCKATFGQQPRLIKFQFSTVQAYILEFGQQYMRVIMNTGTAIAPSVGYVLETSIAITNVTKANPAVVTTGVAHGYSNGDQVYISNVGGMTQVNSTVGKQYLVAGATATTFQLHDLDGNNVNSSAYTAYTSGGNVARVFTLTTTYQWADLPLLKFTQSADTLTLTHPTYAPANITRTGHAAWTLTTITFQATVQAPTSPSVANTGGGTGLDYYYVVTALTDSPSEESVPTAAASVSNKGALDQTTGKNNTITYVAPATGPTPNRYQIYKALPISTGLTAPTRFGLIGMSTNTTFIDTNIAPDFTQEPPNHNNPFATANNFPGTTSYFEQRKTYGGTNNNPETFNMSKPGSYANMDTSDPTVDSDAITGTIVSSQVDAIQHFVSTQSGLLTFTTSGNWQVSGANGASITPANAQAVAQEFVGCSPQVPPLRIIRDVLFVTNQGPTIRDLSFNFYFNMFTGSDMSVLSHHFFDGRQIEEWTYADAPFKIIWAVRDDGIVLSFTYLKEQDVYAWTRHDTQGRFRSVTSITENGEDAVYFIVERYIGGAWHYYAERMASRNMGANSAFNMPSDPAKAWFLDCALQYPLVYPNAQLTVSAATGTVTCTTDNPVFSSATVGNVIRSGGGILTVTVYNSPTSVTATVNQTIQQVIPNLPADLAAIPLPQSSGLWSCTTPATTVTGLDHLNGQEVSIIANGSVQPNATVSNGSITITRAADLITVGLGFTAQLQTLRLDTGEPTIQGKRKQIPAVNIITNDSRGWKFGRSFSTLVPAKQATSPVPAGLPMPLISDVEHFTLDPLWDVEGQICIQQDYPLPLTVLGVVPEWKQGDTAK